jgi:hypothetical protein
MCDTDRNQLILGSSPGFTYEESFIDQVFLGCLKHWVFAIVRNRTLYLYNSKDDYLAAPEKPKMFFNLNHINCTLDEDSL